MFRYYPSSFYRIIVVVASQHYNRRLLQYTRYLRSKAPNRTLAEKVLDKEAEEHTFETAKESIGW